MSALLKQSRQTDRQTDTQTDRRTDRETIFYYRLLLNLHQL